MKLYIFGKFHRVIVIYVQKQLFGPQFLHDNILQRVKKDDQLLAFTMFKSWPENNDPVLSVFQKGGTPLF